MVDYIKALQKGMAAAQIAEKNQAAVDAVFAELDRQLALATDGKVAVQRPPGRATGGRFAAIGPRAALVAVHLLDPDFPEAEIARWEQDPAGFPCRIYLPGQALVCEDPAGLEAGLAELLRHPETGATLHRFLIHEAPHRPAP